MTTRPLIDRMAEALRRINRFASPDPSRTFDDAIRDLDHIAAHARSALTEYDSQKDNSNG